MPLMHRGPTIFDAPGPTYFSGCDIFIFAPLARIERDGGAFSCRDFRWNRRPGVYILPNDKVLHWLR